MIPGYGKIAESISVTSAFISERIAVAAATVYYNGLSITTAVGRSFDTQPYDDCMCVINAGTCQGTLVTIENAIYECDTDSMADATAVSGADFDDITSSSDEKVNQGSVLCRDTKRYLFLRTNVLGTLVTADFGATWIGGSAREQPTDEVLDFDV